MFLYIHFVTISMPVTC